MLGREWASGAAFVSVGVYQRFESEGNEKLGHFVDDCRRSN